MPKMTDMDIQTVYQPGTNAFAFSAVKVDSLQASEYTLVDLAVDISGSVSAFEHQIEKCVKEIIKACAKSPRSDNLLMRVTRFNNRADEVHGYKPLANCNLDNYNGVFSAYGGTALFEATHNAVRAQMAYAKELKKNDYAANGIVFIITDGDDNANSMSPDSVKLALEESKKSEALESLVSILVGVNVQSQVLSSYLNQFQQAAGITQFVSIDDASDKKLARLAEFVSKSIVSQSQALGTGGASQTLTF